jgi:PAS domain S-box-containing protein
LDSLKITNENTPIHVLHVDDDPSLQEITKLMLLDLNSSFDIDWACCVDEAFKKLSAGNYDVVVSDYEMPKKTGLQFLQELRKQKNNIPFILFTGKGREEVAIQALNLGANGYHNKQGSPETVYGELAHYIIQQVNHQNAEKLLEDNQDRAQRLFSAMNEGFCLHELVFDESGKAVDYIIMDVNPAYESILGLKKDEVINRKASEIYGSKNAPFLEVYAKVAETQKSESFETFYPPLKKNFSISAFSTDKNHFATVFTDITERKKTQEVLKESLVDYQNLINGMSETAWVIDFNGTFLEVNNSAVEVLGYSKEELLSIGVAGIDQHLSREQVTELLENLPIVKKQVFETVHTRKDGTKIPVEISSNLITYHGNQVILSVARNIIERKRTEETLKEAKEHSESDKKRLETILETTPSAVVIIEAQSGKFSFVNKRAMQLYGFDTVGLSLDENVAKVKARRIDGTDYPIEEMPVSRSLTLGEEIHNVEMIIERDDGSVIPILVNTAPLRDMQGNITAAIAVFEDITQRRQTEEDLRISEEQFRQLFSNMPSAVAVYEPVDNGKDFVFKDFNAVAERIEKKSRASVLGKRVTEAFPGVASFGIFKVFQRVWQSGKPEYYPTALYKDENDPGTWRENWVYRLPNGNIVAIYNDITERKQTENQLAASENMYRSIVELIPDGIATANLRGTITSVNKAFLDLTGFSKEEIVGKNFLRLPTLRKRDLPKYAKIFADILRGKTSSSFEFVYKRKDKSVHVAEARFIIIKQNNKIEGLQVYLRDLTENRKNETKYRDLADSLPEVVFETDSDGTLRYTNKVAFEIFGYSQEDFEKGLCVFDLIHKKDHQRAKENFRKALTSVFGSDNEYACVRKDGSSFPSMIVSRPIIEANKSIGLRGLAIDLTQRKKNEQEIKNLAKFPLENPFAIMRIDKTGTLLFANPSAKKLICSLEVDVGSVPKRWQKVVVESLESKSRLEIEEKIGEQLFNFSFTPIISEGYVNVYGSDITRRKQAEDALVSLNRRYELAQHAANAGVWDWDITTGKIEWTSKMFELFGFDSKKKEASFAVWESALHPEDKEKAKIKIDWALKNHVFLDNEYRIVLPDGEIRWINALGEGEYDVQGNPLIMSGICIDITERKKAEDDLKTDHKKMEMINEKLNVVGKLTRHDVGNKLMVIKSNLFLLEKQIGDDPKLAKYLKGIDYAINQSEELFEFSRLYERIGVEKPVITNITQCFNEAIRLFSGLERIELVNDCQGLEVMADSLLSKLFYNLIDNSLKHGEKVTQIHLYFTKEGDGLNLFCEDNGVGVSKANKSRLFEAGYSTGKSTGLGLYLVKKMMDVYGWTITEEGEEGKGAKFVISIPMASFSSFEKSNSNSK